MPADFPDWITAANSAVQSISGGLWAGTTAKVPIGAYQSLYVSNFLAPPGVLTAVRGDWYADVNSGAILESFYMTSVAGASDGFMRYKAPVRGGALQLVPIAGTGGQLWAMIGSPVAIPKLCVVNDSTVGRNMSFAGVFVGGTQVIVPANDGLDNVMRINGDAYLSIFANTAGNLYISYIDAHGVAQLENIATVAAATTLNTRAIFPVAQCNLVYIPAGPNAAGTCAVVVMPLSVT